ncbi:Thiol:disulfide interchange protein DsbC [Alteromonadaceae bacterium Bs31]|nr:Thiol:disulfide interchange protein DsbC [Alteromonadaceae bacterium Bs31]
MTIKPPFLTHSVIALAASFTLALTGCNSEADAASGAAEKTATPAESAKAPAQKTSADELKAAEAAIIKNLTNIREGMQIRSVKESAIPGVYEVMIMGQGIIYMDKNGEYFIDGKMLKLDGKRIVNVTDDAMVDVRKDLMATIKKDDSIVFSPEGETKAYISVFTDVDCGYCRKLHQEVPALNALGIEVRYLAYPRAGVNSNSYNKIASAWCADNPQDALSKLKGNPPSDIPMNVCEGNPVAAQFELGQQAGVSGTPAIVLENGQLVPGYMPADRLAERIGIN